MFASRLGFVFGLLAVCLSSQTLHAQSTPVTYWTPGWLGFGGDLNAGQGANTDGRPLGFSESSVGRLFSTRYNFSNGWFVGNERSSLGLSGINQASAFGSLYSEGVQFGYNFSNSPLTVYGGVNTLKYNSGLGSITTPFDSTSFTGGYGAHAGVEFKPASNFSMSVDVGFSQRSGRLDTDTTSASQFGASQYDIVRSRR